MRYAIIENGTVVNVVVADAETASANGWIDCPIAGPGWTYANDVFTAPVVVEPTVIVPTREQLLAELQTLTAKINAME
jgi:hypothetical protein